LSQGGAHPPQGGGESKGALTARTRRLAPLLAALAIVVVCALVARATSAAGRENGRAFEPWPDALEYVAGAQSLVQDGSYLLTVGADRVRPRYPPGWPLVLAAFLVAGVGATELWVVTAAIGVVNAGLVGFIAWRLGRLMGLSTGACAVGALSGGLAWSLAPLAVRLDCSTLSDSWAVLLLAAASVLLLRGVSTRPRAAALGALLGLVVVTRPAAIVAAAPCLGCLFLGIQRGVLRESAGRLVRRAGEALAVFGAVVLATGVLLSSLGVGPQLVAYDQWIPQRYGELGAPFALSNLWSPAPNKGAPREVSGVFAGQVLLGIAGLRPLHYAGYVWPLMVWVGVPVLAWRRGQRWVAAAFVTCLLGHLVFFGTYFFPSSRFALFALAFCAAGLGVAVGHGLASVAVSPRARWVSAAAVVGGIALAQLPALASAGLLGDGLEGAAPPRHPSADRVDREVERWIATDERVRAKRVVPFDPVYAQALGLLPQSRVRDIVHWGQLPETTQVTRLRQRDVAGSQPPPTAPR
jgi:hypothetical protein